MEHNKLKSKYRLVEYRVGNQLDKQLRWRKQYQSRFQSLQQSTWLQGRRRACTLVALFGSSEAPVWEQTCKTSKPSSWSSIPRWCSNHYHHGTFVLKIWLGAVNISRNTWWGGGGLPDLLQYYIGGGLLNLLQYYRGGAFKIYYNITVLKGKWKVIIIFQL